MKTFCLIVFLSLAPTLLARILFFPNVARAVERNLSVVARIEALELASNDFENLLRDLPARNTNNGACRNWLKRKSRLMKRLARNGERLLTGSRSADRIAFHYDYQALVDSVDIGKSSCATGDMISDRPVTPSPSTKVQTVIGGLRTATGEKRKKQRLLENH